MLFCAEKVLKNRPHFAQLALKSAVFFFTDFLNYLFYFSTAQNIDILFFIGYNSRFFRTDDLRGK